MLSLLQLTTPPNTALQQILDHLKWALDIGEQTLELFKEKLASAQTIFWNGPMGYFEREPFAQGTIKLAQILTRAKNAFTIIGGGDSVASLGKSGVREKIDHISTGGGASLEFLQGGTLVAIDALKRQLW